MGKGRKGWKIRETATGQGAMDLAEFAKAKEPFLRRFLRLANSAPGHNTFSRLFRHLDPAQFRAAFQRFMARFSEQCQGVVATDGKVLRRLVGRASEKSELHMVSAWGASNAWSRADPHRRQVERDHGGAKIAGDAGVERHHRNYRRAQLPACHSPANR
jgi:hypothetical protein